MDDVLKRACPCSSLVDLLLGGFGVKLCGLNAAMVEIALDLVDGYSFSKHPRCSPMAKVVWASV